MKRLSATLALLVLVGCVAPGDPHDLGRALRVHDDHPVQVAALVVDLDTNETLYSREAKRLLRPASTMKLLTTAAVCRRAPGAFVQTTLLADAMPAGAVTLLGGGDPFLSTKEVRNLIRSLKRTGLQRVRDGHVRVLDPLDGAPRFGEGWMWDDEPASFMPTISGAIVDGGCVMVETKPTAAGLDASLRPTAGDLELRVRPGPDELQVTRGRYRSPNVITVSGSLPPEETDTTRLTVPDPARHLGWVLANALATAGLLAGDPTIETGRARPDSRPEGAAIALRRPIAEIVERTNKASDNLGAELLLRLLPTLTDDEAELGPDSVTDGLALVHSGIAALGLDPGAYRIADGSGVSHYSLVSAELLVKVLAGMHRLGGRSFEIFERSLPIAGQDGTLARRMQGTAAEGRVRAKTGTISGVSNLAGYVTTKTGRHLAFAVLVQNHVGPAAPWRALQDEFCARLAEL